jgi:hypothetical protein
MRNNNMEDNELKMLSALSELVSIAKMLKVKLDKLEKRIDALEQNKEEK